MSILTYHLDYETYSEADLKKYGAYRYASDPLTKILLCAVCCGDGPVLLWDCKATDAQNAPALEMIRAISDNPQNICYAHNAPFEIAISKYLWQKTFGCKPPALEQWRCTAALCRSAAIPSSLEQAAEFLKLDVKKDSVGKTLIRYFSVPQKKESPTVTINGVKTPRDTAWKMFGDYCKKDVEVEKLIHKRLAPLEFKGWLLDAFQMDLRMNDRGVRVNLEAVETAETIVAEYLEKVEARFLELTGLRTSQRDKVLQWLKERGYTGEDMTVGTVGETLSGDNALTPEAQEALQLRSYVSFAALKKLPTMREAACPDGRIKGMFKFWGAMRTGRYSSGIVQLQNMKRSTPESEAIYRVICDKAIDSTDIELLYGSPVEHIATGIRHFIDPGPGRQFIDVDFSQIEARVLPWLAGDQALLQAFREGKDLYKITYANTFGISYDEVTKPNRQMGKVIVLACIAEGELVLTDHGLIPIEKVSACHRVWDGAEWVHHEGVIFKGIKDVVTYQGLTATPDHRVFVADEEAVPFSTAIRTMRPLYRSLPQGSQVRELDSTFAENSPAFKMESSGSEVQMRDGGLRRFLQPGTREDAGVLVVCGRSQWVEQDGTHLVNETDAGSQRPLREPERPNLQMVWGEGYNLSLGDCGRGCKVGNEEYQSGQSQAARPDRQQQGLRTGEYQMGDFCSKQQEQAQSEDGLGLRFCGKGLAVCMDQSPSVHFSRHDQSGDSGPGAARCEGKTERLVGEEGVVRKARTYDIVNAGPRRRFTVSGVVVHNCQYGGGVSAMDTACAMYGVTLTRKEKKETVKKWRKANPEIVAMWGHMQDAAVKAVQNPGTWVRANDKCRFGVDNKLGYRVLVMELPSGRRLQYPLPEVKEVFKVRRRKAVDADDEDPDIDEMEWVDIPHHQAISPDGSLYDGVWQTHEVSYYGQPPTGVNWGRIRTYGSRLSENETQSVSGDFLLLGTLNAERQGYEPVVTVHDQLLSDYNPELGDSVEGMVEALCTLPSWAKDFPLNAVGGLTEFYTKD